MSSDAVLAVLGSPTVSEELYGTVSTVSTTARITAHITSRLQIMQAAYHLRLANRSVKSLLDRIDNVLTGKTLLDPTIEPPTPQKIEETIDNLMYLSRVIDSTYESMRRARLTNNSITGAVLEKFRVNNESIRDLVDWLDAVAKPENLKTIFDRAKQERVAGELVDISRIE